MIKSIVIMGFVVKNTTKCGLLDLLCPHSCRGCGHLGRVLCKCCKKYMLEQYAPICPICKKTFAKKAKNVDRAESGQDLDEKVNNYAENGRKSESLEDEKVTRAIGEGALNRDDGVAVEEADRRTAEERCECGEEFWKDGKWGGKCPECETGFSGIFAFGWREGALEKLVEEYKYQSVRAMGEELVGLYDLILPELGTMDEDDGSGAKRVATNEARKARVKREVVTSEDGKVGVEREVVVVPLPTIGKHIRERGFDHTLTLARKLAKKRGWKCERILTREVDTVQVGAKVAERKTQAQKAYGIKGKVDPEKVYLLLDDVWTTGATMEAAEKILREAGAKKIYAAVIAVSRPKKD